MTLLSTRIIGTDTDNYIVIDSIVTFTLIVTVMRFVITFKVLCMLCVYVCITCQLFSEVALSVL